MKMKEMLLKNKRVCKEAALNGDKARKILEVKNKSRNMIHTIENDA